MSQEGKEHPEEGCRNDKSPQKRAPGREPISKPETHHEQAF